MDNKGRLIALEGIDGTGKGTQAQMLLDDLRARNIDAALFSFPAYADTLAGGLIGELMDGKLGDPKLMDSRLTAAIYAIDRFEVLGRLNGTLSEGKVVICDRYVGSNMAHQVARAPEDQRERVRKFIQTLEYDVFHLPRPDAVIFLDMSVELAQSRILEKAARQYTKKAMDVAESDSVHLKLALEEYRLQACRSPTWKTVSTTKGTKVRSREEIHGDVMAAIADVLNLPTVSKTHL